MTRLYEIVWQVETDNPALARKAFIHDGGYVHTQLRLDRKEIIEGFPEPEVVDLGAELVIWQTLPNGALAAEGWRRIGGTER